MWSKNRLSKKPNQTDIERNTKKKPHKRHQSFAKLKFWLLFLGGVIGGVRGFVGGAVCCHSCHCCCIVGGWFECKTGFGLSSAAKSAVFSIKSQP